MSALPAVAGSVTVYTNTTALSDTQGSVTGNALSADGFGDGGSWQATGKKVNYYVTPSELFGHDVLVSQISSINYWTNQLGSSDNWNLYIYTKKQGTGDSSTWYRSVLAGLTTAGDGGWDQESTTDPGLFFIDSDRNKKSYTSTITWANIQAGEVSWPNTGTPWDYRGETVQFFSVQVASNVAPAFQGLVDGLTINVNGTSGLETSSVNFESTPEPATWSMFLIGAGLVGLARRYRR